MKKKLHRSRGFTLIELLVVITIIGILASLAIPTIGAALDKANQTKDVNNIKQTGTILFMDANDNGGVFREETDPAKVFEEVYDDGVLTTLSVLAGTGQKTAKDATELDKDHIAWGYNAGLKTSVHPGTILLMSFGTGWDGKPETQEVTPDKDVTKSLWGNKGVVVYYAGGNAKFAKTTGKDTKKATILETDTTSEGKGFKDPE